MGGRSGALVNLELVGLEVVNRELGAGTPQNPSVGGPFWSGYGLKDTLENTIDLIFGFSSGN